MSRTSIQQLNCRPSPGLMLIRFMDAHVSASPSPLRLSPQDHDWETTLQFLPASDSKHLEKKPGRRRRLWVGAGLLLSAAGLALLTGLLVWHFHCESV